MADRFDDLVERLWFEEPCEHFPKASPLSVFECMTCTANKMREIDQEAERQSLLWVQTLLRFSSGNDAAVAIKVRLKELSEPQEGE